MVKPKNWDLEFKHTASGKMIPINDTSPTYSRKAKEEMKRLRKEEQEYIKQQSGEVKTYHISELESK